MAATLKSIDILKDSYLLKGVDDAREGRARRGLAVEGLTGTNPTDDFTEAYSFLESTLADPHPSDSGLRLTGIDMRSLRPGVCLGSAHYRPYSGQVDLRRAAQAQTMRRAGTVSLQWWRDTTAYDGDGLPNGDITFDPYRSDDDDAVKVPRPWAHTVAVQTIEMPTLLDDHPSTLYLANMGKVNSASDYQFLTTGGFPAGTLLFDGWTSRYVGSGKFLVIYRVVYMKEKWPRMHEPVYDAGSSAWTTTITPEYESASFGTLPVHSVIA